MNSRQRRKIRASKEINDEIIIDLTEIVSTELDPESQITEPVFYARDRVVDLVSKFKDVCLHCYSKSSSMKCNPKCYESLFNDNSHNSL